MVRTHEARQFRQLLGVAYGCLGTSVRALGRGLDPLGGFRRPSSCADLAAPTISRFRAEFQLRMGAGPAGLARRKRQPAIDLSEGLYPWDSFDMECRGDGTCEVIFVDNYSSAKLLKRIRIAIGANGVVTYAKNSMQTVSWANHAASPAVAYRPPLQGGAFEEVRTFTPLLPGHPASPHYFPPFRLDVRTPQQGWQPEGTYATWNSWDRGAAVYQRNRVEWMFLFTDAY